MIDSIDHSNSGSIRLLSASTMAFPLYSGVLSNGESSVLLQNRSRLGSCERYGCSRANLNSNLMVRIGSGKWNFRYMKLLKIHQFREGLGSRHSKVGLGITSSRHGIRISSVISEVMTSFLDAF